MGRPLFATTDFIVESRSGGQNFAKYSETVTAGAWADSSRCLTPGSAANGSRYIALSTGSGTAVYKFTPTTTGSYTVYSTNMVTSNGADVAKHTITHAGGSTTVDVNQNSSSVHNQWYSLGSYTLNSGTEYSVTQTTTGSTPSTKNLRACAIRWSNGASTQSATLTDPGFEGTGGVSTGYDRVPGLGGDWANPQARPTDWPCVSYEDTGGSYRAPGLSAGSNICTMNVRTGSRCFAGVSYLADSADGKRSWVGQQNVSIGKSGISGKGVRYVVKVWSLGTANYGFGAVSSSPTNLTTPTTGCDFNQVSGAAYTQISALAEDTDGDGKIAAFVGFRQGSTAGLCGLYLDDASCEYDGSAVLQTVAPSAGSPGQTTATISWSTDESSTSIVDYGTSTSYGSSASGSSGTSHSVSLSSLLPSTLYNYRATSRKDYYAQYVSSNGTFNTLANTPGAPTVSNQQSTSLDVAASATGESPSNPAGTQYAITITGGAFGGTDGVYYVPTGGGTPTGTIAWQAKSSWTAKTVSGLANSTTYTFKIKAKNGDGAETGFGTGSQGTTTSGCTGVTVGTQPTNQTACAPATATFTVAASGTSPFTYQWQKSTDGGSNYSNVTDGTGGTSASYTTPATTTGMNGYKYRCYLTNCGGANNATSNGATLTAKTNYSGTAFAIPCVIQAEDYDCGGEGAAYHDNESANRGGQYRTDGVDIETCTDTGGGYNVGYIETVGEWLGYTVNVATTGTYTVSVRYATPNNPSGSYKILVGSPGSEVDKTGEVSVGHTGGWQVWQTQTTPGVSLTAGDGQRVKFYVQSIASDGFNINWIKFDIEPATPGNPTVAQQNCGNTVIQRSDSPPTGVTWYWQGTSCGTSTDLGSGATYTATSSGTYYIRARYDGSGVWSSGCGSAAVTVTSPAADRTVSAQDSTVCSNSGTNIQMASSESGVSYQLKTDGGTPVGSAQNGNGGTLSFATGNLTDTTQFKVEATKSPCSAVTMTNHPTVTVNANPVAPTSASNNGPICAGTNATLSYVAGSGTTLKWYSDSGCTAYVCSGQNQSVGPLSTNTQYWARWETSTCGNSSTATTTVTVTDPGSAPTITAWYSVLTHGSAGDFLIPLWVSGDVTVKSEPRRDGIKKIYVDFSKAVEASDGQESRLPKPEDVAITDSLSNSYTASQVSLSGGGTRLAIEYSGGLPAQKRYTFALTTGKFREQETATACLKRSVTGDCQVRTLVGDVDSTRDVGTGDLGGIKTFNRQAVNSDNCRYDVNLDGAINIIDMALAMSKLGQSAPQ